MPTSRGAASTVSTMLKQIYVALEHAGKTHPVGVLRFDQQKNFGYFTYLPHYSGPPLDPVNLDYRKPVDPKDRLRRGQRVFIVDIANSPGLMHQVFVDAMPGGWGMAVLQAEYPEIRQMKDAERLHWMKSRTVGALSLFVETRTDEKPVQGLAELEVVRAKCAEFMAKLEKMGLQGVRNPAVASHGGVMPKASYQDNEGRHWIAKFDRPGDGTQFSVLEHAACTMARMCGITLPDTRALADGQGGHMFLTERFDRGGASRTHKASFMTLTGAKDAGAGDYRQMFSVLKDICDPVAWPAQRDELLRRMAFNVGLNVTDDHLRNHEVRLIDSGAWELSPAFDLVPVAGKSPHQCAIFGNARADINLDKAPTRKFWTLIANELGADPEHVLSIVGGVAATLKAEWPALVESVGLNKFNQMTALMAAETGCGIPFPSGGPTPSVALDAKAVANMTAASRTLVAAMKLIRGESVGHEPALVAKALCNLSTAVPRLSQQLRASGHTVAAELLMMAPLMNASKALADASQGDPRMWRDLEEAASSLDAALSTAAAAAPTARAARTPK